MDNNMTEDKNENTGSKGSSKYWLTLDQWRKDPQFQKMAEQEFVSSPMSLGSDSEGGWARREFMKLMGASMALTSFGCVRRPVEKIVPYVKRPVDIVEGIANYYSSSWTDGSEAFGLIVKTREGRPIKVEGNPEHPLNKGGMSARAHAHILSLYDPDRLSGPTRNLLNEKRSNRDTVATTLAKADEAIIAQLKKGNVAILSSSIISPSVRNAVNDFKAAFGARHYVWEPVGAEIMAKGQEISYGKAIVPHFRFDKAKYIVSVDADFLGTYIAPVENMRAFSQGRKPNEEMNKLVAFESLLTLTGANADFRVRIRPSQAADVLMGLLHAIKPDSNTSKYADVAAEIGIPAEVFAEIAKDLAANRGQSIVIAGEDLRAQIAANMLNSALGNDGVTIDHAGGYNGFQGSIDDLKALVQDVKDKKIKTLIIHNVNPAYSAPAAVGVVDAIRGVEMAIYTGSHQDETAQSCEFLVPDHHPMESWGDSEGRPGSYTIQQPTIQPMGATRAFGESLLVWIKGTGKSVKAENWYDYVRQTAATRGASGDDGWNSLLQAGITALGGGAGGGSRSVSGAATSMMARDLKPRSDYELVLYPTVGLRDGTLANVPWLQEFPDPVTKICWDNYLTVSPKLADEKGLAQGQVVNLKVGDKTLAVPVHIQPGQHDQALGLAVGYGRKAGGRVANNVGVNAYELAAFDGKQIITRGLAASFTKTMTNIPLANVAGHNSMEGRQIVVEATLADYKKDPNAGIHRHKIFSAWSGHKYEGYKWAMSIDLNSCTGCSACMIACQSENNIHVVGKKHVLNGREMHWIRVDRYYVGDPSNPDTVFQPLPCMHCDNAPCETVCPVLATVHSDEGTNDMIYNRCVGTRYCSNNCPYKVRRFNWFNYIKEIPSPQHLALNPDVTVRSRGVMEKCSFCKHKIQSARSKAKIEGRKIRDGEVVTACQASCPTGAIVFGDMNDPASRVSKAFKEARTYQLLEELNTQPAVRYQAKIRNTAALKEQKHHGAPEHEKPTHVKHGEHV